MGVDTINLTQDWEKWRTLVNTAYKFGSHEMRSVSLTGSSRRTAPCRSVSWHEQSHKLRYSTS